jgi:hypothetical protein
MHLQNKLATDPFIYHLSQKMKAYVHINTNEQMLIEALFLIAPN